MNKAEKQYLYNLQKSGAMFDVMEKGWRYKDESSEDFKARIRRYCEHFSVGFGNNKGRVEYCGSIIHAIDFGTIKDWPSFVEYMTGEDYVEKPKCETCNDTKEVPAPHYSKGGEIPDSDTIVCKKCNGSGHKDE